jgi:ABC-type spermidine/putrescine transport system permease subunit II
MKVLTSPLSFIGMVVFLFGAMFYFIFAPIAYPFLYSMNLMIENEIYTWDHFSADVYDNRNSVKSSHKKLEDNE